MTKVFIQLVKQAEEISPRSSRLEKLSLEIIRERDLPMRFA